MDEFQFIESLDALLASEAIDEASTAAAELANSSSNASMNLSMNTSTNTSPLHGQGILLGIPGRSTIAGNNNASCNWLGGNDGNNNSNNNISTSSTSFPNPFEMPLHAPAAFTAISSAPSIAPEHSFQHFSPPATTTTTTTVPATTATATATATANTYMEQNPSGLKHPTGMNVNVNSTGTGTNANTTRTVPGRILPSAVLTDPNMSLSLSLSLSRTTQGAGATTATNAETLASSAAASVCSANSRGSSHASSSKQRSINNKASDDKAIKALSRKRSRTTTAVSESEDEGFRRRYDRNLREQRRSQKITHQIDELREVLAGASVRFKPDKYSTLVSVVEYVKQLQSRSTMLDMEHKKLLDTITRTNEMVNEPYLANSSASASSAMGSSSNNNGGMGTNAKTAQPDSTLSGGAGAGAGNVPGGPNDIYNEDELVFVRNVDYKCIFDRCGMALAVASIDGRLMDCNEEFVKITGYRREELLPVEQQQQQQSSVIIADEVGSSHLPGAVFPDAQSSSSNGNDNNNNNMRIKQNPNAKNWSKTNSSKLTNNATPVRNFSLFNLLSRNHMEDVFVSLSEMLKHPPKDENGAGLITNADYWSGNVRLSRNTHLEIRINVSLVRSPQGRAKFFDCSLTPVPPG